MEKGRGFHRGCGEVPNTMSGRTTRPLKGGDMDTGPDMTGTGVGGPTKDPP